MKYCPAPRCDKGRVIISESLVFIIVHKLNSRFYLLYMKVAIGSGVGTVRCSCSYPFCFRCGEEAHEPTSCAQLAEWTQKCTNESETVRLPHY